MVPSATTIIAPPAEVKVKAPSASPRLSSPSLPPSRRRALSNFQYSCYAALSSTTKISAAGGPSGPLIGWDLVSERHAEEELRRVAAAIPGAIYRYRLSPDGTSGFTFMSPGVEALTGVPRDLAEMDFAAFEAGIQPDDRQRVASSVRQSAQSRTAWSCDFRTLLPDGQPRWLRGTAVPEVPAADGTLYWNGTLTDITRENSIEQELTRVRNEDDHGADGIHRGAPWCRICCAPTTRPR